MAAELAINDVVVRIGRAAVDADYWPVALQSLSEMSGSVGGCMITVEGEACPKIESPELADLTRTYFRDGWFARDERYKCLPMIRRRGVGTELDFTTIEETERHPYWQEWLAPYNLRWFAGVKVAFGNTLWSLSLQRSTKRGPFLPEEVDVLAKLSEHLSSAAALSQALGFAKLEGMLGAFEHSKRAVALIDWMGKVSAVNNSAKDLLGSDLQIKQGLLVCSSPAATARLRSVIEQHLSGAASSNTPSSVPLPRQGRRPIIAHITKPPDIIGDIVGRCVCIVTFVDLDDLGASKAKPMMDGWGLTEAEARVAISVAAGVPLSTLSQTLGVSYETVRTQLRSIFAKTGVARQAELAALLTTFAERMK